MYIDTCIGADPLELSRATTEEGEKLPQFAIARDRGMRLLAITSLRIILGLYGDNGKENGNYYNGVIRVLGLGSLRHTHVSWSSMQAHVKFAGDAPFN